MWKKQDDARSTPLEFGSNQLPELSPEALVEVVTGLRDNLPEKEESGAGLQMNGAELQKPLSPPSMTTYTDALNKFTKNATEFIEHLPLLSDARDAYVQAMKASRELRQILDSGDEKLRTLMIRMEQMVNNIHIVGSARDRKNPEASKVETIRVTDEGTGGLKKPL